MKKSKKSLVGAEFAAGVIRAVLVAILFALSLCVCAALPGCNALKPAPVETMTAEEIEAEKAKAAETVELGKTVAESGEYLPFPLNLIAAVSGGALIILGGKKAAKLAGTAATKIIVPAIAASAGKILKKETDATACNEAADTTPKSEPENGEPKK